MCGKVIDWPFYGATVGEGVQLLDEEPIVQTVRVVEIDSAPLFKTQVDQILVVRVMGNQNHTIGGHFSDDRASYRRLSCTCSADDSDG